MSQTPHHTPPEPVFLTTRWTLVMEARGKTDAARQALSDLCQAYWQPVFRFLQREGRSEEDARELIQAFFARLLQGNGLGGLERGKARFRSYLLGALKHFLSARRQHDQRLKRGGGIETESLEARLPGDQDNGFGGEIPDPAAVIPDAHFDRDWALAVMDGALTSLRNDFIARNKREEFETLKPWLAGVDVARTHMPTQAEAAAALGMNESAFKVAVHRLRQRFRELVRKELAQTVTAESEIESELRYLIEVLATPR